MRKVLIVFGFIIAALVCSPRVQAAVCSQAFIFQTGQVLTASNLNANPANEVACINNIDGTNIGAVGLFASNINPQTTVQGTFGGTTPYTFTVEVGGNAAGSGLTLTGNNGPMVVAQVTAAPTAQPGNIGLAGTMYFKTSGTNTLCVSNDAGCSPASQPYIETDSAATAGIGFNVPTSSTNGYVFRVNGTSVGQLTAAGAFTAGGGGGVEIGGSCGASPGIFELCSTAGVQSLFIPLSSTAPFAFANAANSVSNLVIKDNGNVTIAGSVAASAQLACSASSGWPCETTATCTTASSTTCTATATVPAGSVCTAVGNLAAGGTGPILTWLTTLVSTTLSMIIENGTSGSVAVGVNITCN